MKILNRIGGLIRKQRLARGLSQEALGHEADLHRTYISSLERGLRNPTIIVLQRIAGALDISVSKLVSGLKKTDGG